MGDYIKCPRCELNYIKRGEEYCDVCKAQLKKGPQLVFAVDDEEDEVEETKILCPICHHNLIDPDQQMCDKCASEIDYKTGQIDMEKDEEWKNFLDEDEKEEPEDAELESLNKLAEEEGSEMFKDDDEEEEEDLEEAPVESEPDDFEIPEIDESDFEEEDDEEDEDSEDDDNDEE